MQSGFDHERLHVYQAAIQFVGSVEEMLHEAPANTRNIADQLRRAAQSVPLNIAEGNGKRKAADRMRFFDIARGSAMECAACLDVLVAIGAKEVGEVADAKLLLKRIVAMLSKMTEPREGFLREDVADYGYAQGEWKDNSRAEDEGREPRAE